MEEPIKQFLTDQKISIIRETARGELNARCPFPDHDDSHSSFSINGETGLWKCHGCGRKGNIEYLYALLLNVDIWEAIKQVREKYGVDVSTDRITLEFGSQTEHIFEEIKELRVLFGLLKYKAEPPEYYRDRGFSLLDWILWEGRIDESRNLIVFPVKSLTGQTRGLVGRSVKGDTRFMNYSGSRTATTFYGIHFAKGASECILVEGLFDVQRLSRVLDDYDVDVVGLLGSGLSDEQEQLLSMWDTVNLFLDNDEAGEEAQEVIAKKLMAKGKRVNIVPYFTDGKDPAQKEVREESLIASFENRQSYLKTLMHGRSRAN